MKRPGLLVAFVLLVGIAGTVVGLIERGGDTVLVAQQRDLVPVSASAVQTLLKTTHDPRPTSSHGRALEASCQRGGSGGLGNPWSCSVRYPTSPAVAYRVIVNPNRSISGRAAGGPRAMLVVHGCCVAGVP